MASKSEQQIQQARKLIPIPQFNDYHPDPTPAALRWLIFTNKDDFKRCLVRRGRRVLIDEAEYFRWLDETSGSNRQTKN